MLGKIGRWLVRLAAPSNAPDLENRALLRAAPFPDAWRSITESDLPWIMPTARGTRARVRAWSWSSFVIVDAHHVSAPEYAAIADMLATDVQTSS